MEPKPAVVNFEENVIAVLPELRRHAFALTRNSANAEDLVQDAVCNALAARNSFVPFGSFSAWMHRILYNRFLTNIRKQRQSTDFDYAPESLTAIYPKHDDYLALQEIMVRLTSAQRHLLGMFAVLGMSYEEIAVATGCGLGATKSRISRLRHSKMLEDFREEY